MQKLRLFAWFAVWLTLSFAAAGTASAQAPSNCVNRVMVWDGDTLTRIAARHNVVLAELAAVNGLPPNAQLKIGQVLCLDGLVAAQPAASSTTGGTGGPTTTTPPSTSQVTGQTTTPPTSQTTAPQAPAPPVRFMRGQNPTVPAGWTTYTVVLGDGLFKIAKALGVGVGSIIQANNITDPNLIFLGETLLIPPASGTGGATTPTAPTTPATTTTPPATTSNIPVITLQPNVAKPGDSISVIGSNYPPNATVQLYLEKPSLGLKSGVLTTVIVAANGTFTQAVTIPTTWTNGAPVNQPTVSISGYTTVGGFWAMNYFINTAR